MLEPPARRKRATFLALALLVTTSLAGCAAPDEGGDPILVGTLLPLTGSLAIFGGDMEKSVQMAVDEINEAGGVLGRDLELVTEDSRTDSSQAPQAMSRLVQAGVVAVIGAASSGVTGSVIGQAVDNQIVMVTPASTAPSLTNRENNGYFWRVPPNDALQGKVMAQLLDEEGITRASTLYVNNDYGQGFNDVLQQEFLTRYQGVILNTVAFDEKSTTFDSEINRATADDPDAVVFIGYPGEGVPLMRQAFQAGEVDRPWFFSEGVFSQSFVDDVGEGDDGPILSGFQGTTPEILLSPGSDEFQDRFEAKYGHKPQLFSSQSYDAMIAVALAIEAAGSADPADFKESMRDVWNSPGEAVRSFDAGKEALEGGSDVDYSGASGDFNWDERGDPVKGIYAIWSVAENGTIEVVDQGIEVES